MSAGNLLRSYRQHARRLGRPTDIVSSIVLVFIIFGAILEATGATAILLKIATAATARIRRGTFTDAYVTSAGAL